MIEKKDKKILLVIKITRIIQNLRATFSLRFYVTIFTIPIVSKTFRRDDSITHHLVSSPSFASQFSTANDGDVTRWPMIE